MTSKLLIPFVTMAVQMIIDSHLVREYEITFLPMEHWQKSSKKFISKITKRHIVIKKARTTTEKKLADKSYFLIVVLSKAT